jgi:hypothetical protein
MSDGPVGLRPALFASSGVMRPLAEQPESRMADALTFLSAARAAAARTTSAFAAAAGDGLLDRFVTAFVFETI